MILSQLKSQGNKVETRGTSPEKASQGLPIIKYFFLISRGQVNNTPLTIGKRAGEGGNSYAGNIWGVPRSNPSFFKEVLVTNSVNRKG